MQLDNAKMDLEENNGERLSLTVGRKLEVQDWGRTRYVEAWDRQKGIFEKIVQRKLERKKLGLPESDNEDEGYVIFTEHEPVITLGKGGKVENLLQGEAWLQQAGIEYYPTSRGGDITYHGPGQLVCYPIVDLELYKPDIHRYMRALEEAVIRTVADYGIQADRLPGATGVWLDVGGANERKICAMGVKCSRWVTMHGLALNVHNDLTPFGYIVPCGLASKGVTSMSLETGSRIDIAPVQARLEETIKEELAEMRR